MTYQMFSVFFKYLFSFVFIYIFFANCFVNNTSTVFERFGSNRYGVCAGGACLAILLSFLILVRSFFAKDTGLRHYIIVWAKATVDWERDNNKLLGYLRKKLQVAAFLFLVKLCKGTKSQTNNNFCKAYTLSIWWPE